MNSSRKITIQLELVTGDCPTIWRPPVPKATALMMLDEQIRRAEMSIEGLREMRLAIDAAEEPPRQSGGEK